MRTFQKFHDSDNSGIGDLLACRGNVLTVGKGSVTVGTVISGDFQEYERILEEFVADRDFSGIVSVGNNVMRGIGRTGAGHRSSQGDIDTWVTGLVVCRFDRLNI